MKRLYLIEAIHELVHAQQFHRLVRKNNWSLPRAGDEHSYINRYDVLQYDKNEIAAEGLALRRAERFLGKIPRNEKEGSLEYIQEYRDNLGKW